MKFDFYKFIFVILILWQDTCFSAVINNCMSVNEDILCLSNDFSYNYSISIEDIVKQDISLINFDNCHFFYENSLIDKQICDKYKIKRNKKNINFIPLTKQFFTTIKFGFFSDNKYVNKNIINGYSPIIGKFNENDFHRYWKISKNNFKLKNNSIHVVCPVVNPQAIMSFNNNLKASFTVDVDIRSSNINHIPSPIFAINKELFIYINSKGISIDFPQKLKIKKEIIKCTPNCNYSITIKKVNNNLQVFMDGNRIYEGRDVLERRQWSSFEIRIAAKSTSFYIDKLVIY